MSEKPDNKEKTKTKAKTKRLSKGKRIHVRRMKKAAREEGKVYKPGIV